MSKLAVMDSLNIAMLDRGDAPAIPGLELVDFPSYTGTFTAADSLLIEHLCQRLNIDVFTSTGYTSATTTAQVQLVYDMIPEVFEQEVPRRASKEKKLALSYASHFGCISKSTHADFLKFYPEIDRSRLEVMYCGVDTNLFGPQASLGVANFRERYGLHKPYFLFVGYREAAGDYKNAKLFFDAIQIDKAVDFDIVCVGGEPSVNKAWLQDLPSTMGVKRLELSDQELSSAYAGAIALVYPSLYEGFGLPVLEAMASGCPVITTRHGSLGEIAGDAALFISGHDTYEMFRASELIRQPGIRKNLVEAGLKHASSFTWERSAQIFLELMRLATSEREDALADEFHRRWAKLRRTQASVDVGLD